jgi:hypothetical protein
LRHPEISRGSATLAERETVGRRARARSLNDKIDKNHEAMQARFATVERNTDRIGTKLTLLIWLVGMAMTVVPTVITVGRKLGWF